MVNYSFYEDSEGSFRLISNVDASDYLPDKVARIHVSGPFDSNTFNYQVLTRMLKNSTKKLKEIEITGISAVSPEFLALLVLIYNKTNSLHISECPLPTCAAGCLKALLLSHDGITCLKVSSYSSPTNQAKILLEGVASSPSLEIFEFDVNNFDSSEVDVARCLIQALRRNQGLKKIILRTNAFSGNEFADILKASTGPNVKDLCIMGDQQDVQIDVLQDALCRQDCTLEKLELTGISISTRHDRSGSIIQNVSVKNLTVNNTSSDWDKLAKIIGLFKSVEELDLYDNEMTQLSFLDPLLFGKSSQLKGLDIRCNSIGEEEMIRFAKKLRQIRGLKYLDVGENGCEDLDSVRTALIDALRDNRDLEEIDIAYRTDLPLDLNRGGRRVFESSQPFPTNLLPHVLERASKIKYYESSDSWDNPTNERPRADVVFWMIHRIAPQL